MLKYKVKKNLFPSKITSEEYIRYLNSRGIEIGKGTHFFDPQNTTVDTQRPWMLHIGEYCKITSGGKRQTSQRLASALAICDNTPV